jgi:hypothetical protein
LIEAMAMIERDASKNLKASAYPPQQLGKTRNRRLTHKKEDLTMAAGDATHGVP